MKFPHIDTLRNIIVIGLIDQMIEHHESMVMLIRAGKIGVRVRTLSKHLREHVSRRVVRPVCDGRSAQILRGQ